MLCLGRSNFRISWNSTGLGRPSPGNPEIRPAQVMVSDAVCWWWAFFFLIIPFLYQCCMICVHFWISEFPNFQGSAGPGRSNFRKFGNSTGPGWAGAGLWEKWSISVSKSDLLTRIYHFSQRPAMFKSSKYSKILNESKSFKKSILFKIFECIQTYSNFLLLFATFKNPWIFKSIECEQKWTKILNRLE